ncbi:MAG: MMPL family transporter, partial [Verrucomicrobia bacterium]|nr:MMPL family transporter [Verrucomicrobiota bacterium]
MSFQHGIVFRVLRGLATLVYRLAWPIVILSLALAAASVILAARHLTFTGNPNDLLRSDASYHQQYLKYTREVRAEEDYAIVVCGPDFERNKACVNFIAEKLQQRSDLFKKIFYRVDFGELTDRGLLYLETDQLKQIEQGIGDFTKLLGKDDFQLDLNSLLSIASAKLDPKALRHEKDPTGLDQFVNDFVHSLDALADRLEGKATSKPVSFGNFIAEKAQLGDMDKERSLHEYLSFEQGRILIIQVPSPNIEASFGEHQYVIRPMKEIVDQARAQFPGLEIGLTGEPALSEDEALASTRDTTISSIVTFILIALLFWFSFREFSRPALALLTLMTAVCWTVGFTTLSVGRLNILSITFIPMILGLGIDFGIQILGRYEEELPKTADVITALTHTIMHTGNAIITGG